MSRRIVISIMGCLLAAVGLLVGESGPTSATSGASPGRSGAWLTLTSGGYHDCGIHRDHTLWCWGSNATGQLGVGDLTDRIVPTQVGTDRDWASVTAGIGNPVSGHGNPLAHTCAIKTDHTLWCWGVNLFGELGLGDTTDRAIPAEVGSDSDWAQVSAGGGQTCALRTDHSAWCWGANGQGQLGLADTVNRLVPAKVGVDIDWAQVTAGSDHTCGVHVDHTLWCWGDNYLGQLGQGDQGEDTNRTIPTQVGTSRHWADASPGFLSTCATRTTHALWCWGDNRFGQLGVGDRLEWWSPMRVGVGTNWLQVSLGTVHTCGTQTDHTLWCWGYNRYEHLDADVPTQVGTDTNWAGVRSGWSHNCAIRTGHTVWCWGKNNHGQLGLGDLHRRRYPERV